MQYNNEQDKKEKIVKMMKTVAQQTHSKKPVTESFIIRIGEENGFDPKKCLGKKKPNKKKTRGFVCK